MFHLLTPLRRNHYVPCKHLTHTNDDFHPKIGMIVIDVLSRSPWSGWGSIHYIHCTAVEWWYVHLLKCLWTAMHSLAEVPLNGDTFTYCWTYWSTFEWWCIQLLCVLNCLWTVNRRGKRWVKSQRESGWVEEHKNKDTSIQLMWDWFAPLFMHH